jgi:hypothetical protein
MARFDLVKEYTPPAGAVLTFYAAGSAHDASDKLALFSDRDYLVPLDNPVTLGAEKQLAVYFVETTVDLHIEHAIYGAGGIWLLDQHFPDTDAAIAAQVAAEASAVSTAADRIQTAADRVQTGLDVTAANAGAAAATGMGYPTRALMDAAAGLYTEGQVVRVTNDPTPANNGDWIKGVSVFTPSSFDRVALLEQPQQKTAPFTNLFTDYDLTRRPYSSYLLSYAGSTSTLSYATSLQFQGIFGNIFAITSDSTAAGYRGFMKITKVLFPSAFLSTRLTVGFFFKAETAGQYRFIAALGAPDVYITLAAGQVTYIQRTFDINTTTTTTVDYAIVRRNTADDVIGSNCYISAPVVYAGEARSLRDYSSLYPDNIRDLYLASTYPKQFTSAENLFKDHLLMQPVADHFVSADSAIVVYDDTVIFPNIPRTIKTTWANTTLVEKNRIYFRYSDGLSAVKAEQKVNIAVLMMCSVDCSFRMDYQSTQYTLEFEANVPQLVELQGVPYAVDTTLVDYLTFPLHLRTAIAGSMWMSPPHFYVGEKQTYTLHQRNKWTQWGRTKYQEKKVAFLGDSMSVNTIWQPWLQSRYGWYHNNTETTAGTDGHKPTAVGGSMVIPVQINANIGNNSIYERARDLHYYSPEIIFIFGGLNDKGFFTPSSIIPIGNATETPLKTLDPISSADYTALNFPAGLSFAATYRGMVENIIDDNPSAKMYLMTLYPCQARSSETGLPLNIEAGHLAAIEAMNTVIRDIGKIYGIRVIDLFYDAGLSVYQFKDNLFVSSDGTHLLDAGQVRMAVCIAETLGLP